MTPEVWRPSATPETLRARADLFARIRSFFAERGVMEVDTPMLSQHATVDRHIESFEVKPAGWLHTSPEFAMKRLLASGSGPIYQLCHVFRAEESGRWHNPEFLMLEWYRPGWDHHPLMDEVESLLAAVGGPASCERLSYREAFLREAGFDPFAAPLSRLQQGIQAPEGFSADEKSDRDVWLDLWMSQCVGPKLGQTAPCLLYDFPASQAALAKIRHDDPPTAMDGGSAARGRMPEPPVAERFELFWKGIELANGFHELTDAAEQENRFKNELAWRKRLARKTPPYDTRLIAGLQSGLPACAGVALGVDRLLMLLLGLPALARTMAFDSSRA